MTQPDGLFPSGAFNIDSLAELAARPQSEWEAQMRGQTSAGFEVILSSLFGPLPADLQEGIEFTRAVITAIIRQILNLPGQIWDSLDDAFSQLGDWAQNIPGLSEFLDLLDKLSGIFGGIDWDDPPTPEELWQQVVSVFIEPLNLLLGPNSPLNLANAFGKLLPFNISGLGLSQLTTAVENLLEGFITAGSVPDEDGWSWDSTIGSPGSAKVVADGTTKTLYAPDVIQVSEGQKLNPLEIKVQYAGVVSGVGQTIKFVLETFSDTLGQVPVGTEIVGAITNPSGSAGPTTLAFPDWTPPAGVLTVLPALVVDSSVTAGSVNWWAPKLEKPLDPVLAGGLPAALNNLGDWIESLVDQLLGAVGLPSVGSLLDKIFDLSDEIGDWLLDTQSTAAGLADLLGDFDGFLSSSWQALLDGVKGATGGGISDIINRLANITSGGLFDAAKLSAVTGTAPQSLITDLPTDLGSLQTTLNQIGEIFENNVVTPVNSIVSAIKDWWNAWFRGGSTNAIPLSQKGAANGVAPLNSSTKVATSYLETNVNNGVAGLNGSGKVASSLLVTDSANNVPLLDGAGKIKSTQLPDFSSTYLAVGQKGAANGVAPLNANAVVPLANLPEEVGGTGGTGDGRPYVRLHLPANQTIPATTETLVSGWAQTGPAAVTFEDGTNTRWKFGLPGLWEIVVQFLFTSTSATGIRELFINRYVEYSGVGTITVKFAAGQIQAYASTPQRAWRGSTTYVARVVDETVSNVIYRDDDWFSVGVWQNGSGTQSIAGSAEGVSTFITCVYLGAA